jgi:hypothetical protein
MGLHCLEFPWALTLFEGPTRDFDSLGIEFSYRPCRVGKDEDVSGSINLDIPGCPRVPSDRKILSKLKRDRPALGLSVLILTTRFFGSSIFWEPLAVCLSALSGSAENKLPATAIMAMNIFIPAPFAKMG